MEYIIVGRKYNEGKIAYIKCFENCPLENISIKNKCFLLIILTEGTLKFKVNSRDFIANSPSFLCFDESENPIFITNNTAKYFIIYFHPNFLNINISFELLRESKYDDIATTHDMFMLKPFVNNAYVIPILETQIEPIRHSAKRMREELENQRDWYWSCRGRSYFIEIIITLESMYGLVGYGLKLNQDNFVSEFSDSKLRNAVLFIESHYAETITLNDIAIKAGLNHTTLTALMKKEFNCTTMEYLTKYRVSISKKHLAFTDVPIKDIAIISGFKTVQHFTRIFKKYLGYTPAEFRKNSVQNRKEDFNGKQNN